MPGSPMAMVRSTSKKLSNNLNFDKSPLQAAGCAIASLTEVIYNKKWLSTLGRKSTDQFETDVAFKYCFLTICLPIGGAVQPQHLTLNT